MGSRSGAWGLTAGCVALAVAAGPAGGAPAGGLDPAVERAALAEDWATVVERSGPDGGLAGHPVAALVKAHALLALNRNDESLVLLLGVRSAKDLAAWLDWSARVAAEHRSSHVALYFRGDALARREEWRQAIDAFGEALRLKPAFALALNARGVARCASGAWDGGRADFAAARAAAPSFADAYASTGTALLLESASAGDRDYFSLALERAPRFALAVNGRGAREFVQGYKHLARAAQEFKAAGEQLPLTIVAANLAATVEASVELTSRLNLSFSVPQLAGCEGQPLPAADGILSGYLPGREHERPAFTRPMVDRLNALLEEPAFYERHRATIDLAIDQTRSARGERARRAIEETGPSRAREPSARHAHDRALVRGLNRAIVEMLVPCIDGVGSTRAGMSLTVTGGLVADGRAYKQGLPAAELLQAKRRMEYLYRPLADALETLGGEVPLYGAPLKFLGKGWNRHLDSALRQTNAELERRNINTQTGGVAIDTAEAFHGTSSWQVVSWFGLAYHVAPPAR